MAESVRFDDAATGSDGKSVEEPTFGEFVWCFTETALWLDHGRR